MSEGIKVGDWVEYIDNDESLKSQLKIGDRFEVLNINDLGLIGIGGGFGCFNPSRFKKCSPPEQETKKQLTCEDVGCPCVEPEYNPWLPASEMVEGAEYECDMNVGRFILLNNIITIYPDDEQLPYFLVDSIGKHNIHTIYTKAKFRRLDAKT